MKAFILVPIFLNNVHCQVRRGGLAQVLTSINDGSNEATRVYIPKAGKTSRVAAPTSTPTPVYNCYNMPLICENVASFAKAQGHADGDLDGPQLFYFDPNESNKDARRKIACGNFPHDTCPTQTSKGKRAGDLIADIVASNPDPILTPIEDFERAHIAIGFSPSLGKERVPYEFPGRFAFQGVAYSCDEFPAATWIEGGTDAHTICALQNWRVYTSNKEKPGKWPMMRELGRQQEQDWHGLSHDVLRVSALLISSVWATRKG